MEYTLASIAEIVGGKLVGPDRLVTNIIYDSRKLSGVSTTLFVAIKGRTRDGHLFIGELIDRGVRAFIVEESFDTLLFAEVGFVVVKNSVTALQSLAEHHRAKMTMPIVAVTGSAGKTIVKEWIYQCWSGGKIFRSPRSYNSQIGVALSLLMLTGDERLAVIETAISEPHEMDNLQKMVRPNIAIITNIGEAHQENFRSYEHKLHEKLVIANESEAVIFPADHALVSNTVRDTYPEKRLFSWGKNAAADVHVVEQSPYHVKFEYERQAYTIPLSLDDTNIYENILSVISLYALLGHDLSQVCQRCSLLEGVEVRLKVKNGLNNCKVIVDNSRGDLNAIKIALESLVSVTHRQRKVVILSEVQIAGIAQLLRDNDVYKVISIGCELPEYQGRKEHFGTMDDFLRGITPFEDSAILIIGEKSDKISALFDQKRHSTVMEVNLSALIHNLAYYKKMVGKEVKVLPMVKASSYGSGSFEVAEALLREGVDYFAVAYLDEGIALRERDINTPIIILNANVNDYDLILKHSLQPEIYSLYTLDKFIEICIERGFTNYPIHIKMDTGMSRLGFSESDIPALKSTLKTTTCISVESVFSHLSSADMPKNDSETHRQIALFEKMSAGIPYKLRHLCNSAGMERFPQAHYDMVRLGIGLYGISPIDGNALENVNSLHTIVLQVRNVPKGTHIGYGMRGYADKEITLATVGIGYADGLHRALGNGVWSMRVRGAEAPIVGSICMDTCMLDVTGLNVKEGDNVVVFETSQDICRMAKLLGTIPYEILTSISARIKRVYISE